MVEKKRSPSQVRRAQGCMITVPNEECGKVALTQASGERKIKTRRHKLCKRPV